MNYSTSFLDLCSCALGGLLLLMFLLIPQSKSKSNPDFGNRPSILIQSYYPVYDNNDISVKSRLPFSLDNIKSIRIGLSTGQFHEFKEKDGSDLWNKTKNSSSPFEFEIDDCKWTLTIVYDEPQSGNAGRVSVCANLELPDDNFEKLDVAMGVSADTSLIKIDAKAAPVNRGQNPKKGYGVRYDKVTSADANEQWLLKTLTLGDGFFDTEKEIKGDFFANVSIFLKDPAASGDLNGFSYIDRTVNNKIQHVFFNRHEKENNGKYRFEEKAQELVQLKDQTKGFFYCYASFKNEEDVEPSVENSEFQIINDDLYNSLTPF